MPETETPPEGGTDAPPETPPADAPPEVTGEPKAPETISVEEAKRQQDRMAAAARKATEAELTEKFQAEIAELQAKAARAEELEAAEKEREREKMTASERVEAEKAELAERLQALEAEVQKRDAILDEVKKRQTREQIDAKLKADAPDLPPLYKEQFYRQFAGTEFDADAFDAAVNDAKSEWNGYLQTAGLKPAPTSVGSPGSPPAPPKSDRDSQLEDLIRRVDAGDPEAEAELMKAYGGGGAWAPPYSDARQ